MKKIYFLFVLVFICIITKAQDSLKIDSKTLLAELATSGCNCIDSIATYNRSKEEVTKDINGCIDKNVGAYQLGSKLSSINVSQDDKSKKNKKVDISINTDPNSKEYKKYYYEMERYMMSNCSSLKAKIASNEKQSEKSFSKNEIAVAFYTEGIEEAEKKNYEKAINFYEKAVKADPDFAFAWDNLGLTYRKINNYDKAIEAYKKSLEIDPNGMMPLQNIAVVCQYKAEFKEAVNIYKRLAELDPRNPETYYGIGHIYVANLNEFEKGLDNLCKAYNIYIEQKSPYRTDAEKLIGDVYNEMKKQGKESTFNKILKANKIILNKLDK